MPGIRWPLKEAFSGLSLAEVRTLLKNPLLHLAHIWEKRIIMLRDVGEIIGEFLPDSSLASLT